jgi:tRNA (guanine37-N1)-methyltransferase
MRFDVVTIFPKIFSSYINESLISRARKNGVLDIKIHNLRDFTPGRARGKRRQVDDKPFGGGPGMVLKIEPIYKAIGSILRISKRRKARIILFSTRGKKLDSKVAKRLSKYNQLILICGRYEGVDERVAKYIADEEISVGDYVLSGGELPALVLIETVSRFLPGFLGKTESLEEIKGSYPVYTRPPKFFPEKLGRARPGRKSKPWSVPEVLLSGNHKKIQSWRMMKK